MTSAAIYSHALGAVVLSLVSLSTTHQKNIRQDYPWLILSFWVTALWSLVLVGDIAGIIDGPVWVMALSALRTTFWCLCLGGLLKTGHYARRVLKFTWPGFLRAVSFLGTVTIALTLSHQSNLTVVLILHTALAVVGLFLAEQLFRNARREHRSALLALSICVGCLCACDFYLYASHLFFQPPTNIFGALSLSLSAFVAPVFAVCVIWQDNWQAKLKLDGVFFFQSLSILGAAAYLLLNLATSLVWQYSGGTSQEVVEIIFALCIVGIAVPSLSSKLVKARFSNLLTQNLFSQEYNWREEWSRFSHMLSNEQHQMELPERVIFSMASMISSSGGVLYEAHKNHFIMSAQWGMSDPTEEVTELPASLAAVCQTQTNVMERAELEQTHRQWFDKHWPRIAYLVPLTYNNVVVGLLCLRKPSGDFHLTWEVLNLLKTAGIQAAVSLAQNRNTQALSQARQFEGFNRLSTFMMHDVKNIIMQLSLTLANAEKHRDNPEFIESMLKTIGASVQHLQQMVQQLQSGQSKQMPKMAPFEVLPVIQAVVEERGHSEPVPQWINHISDQRLCVLGNTTQFRSVLRNLLHNAQEATPRHGRVKLSTLIEGNNLTITVEDTGCGMSESFIKDGLFNPFVTTKGSCGMGIGAYEAKAYMQAIGGKIQVHSVMNKGTRFTLRCPLAVTIAQTVVS